MRVREVYHVESYDIAERDLTRLVLLHKDPVDDLRAAASGQAQHKRLVLSGSESLDTAYMDKTNALKQISPNLCLWT